MSLLDMLKSLLGRGSSRERRSRQRNVGVTVEHEPGDVAPETATEDAVKGTDVTAGTGTQVGAGRESRSPTGSVTETEEDQVEIPDAEELASDSGEDREEAAPVEIPDAEELHGVGGGETETEAESEPTSAEPDLEPEAADESTTVIKGIGDTYAERLADAGIETVGDLAAADPAEVADESGVSESRLERWTERARNR